MVQYYNFTKFNDSEGLISFWKILSEFSNYWFGVMMVALIFIIPLIIYLRKGEEPNTAIMASSLFASVAGLVFYLGQIVPNGLIFYLPSLIFTVTVIVRWYNKQV